MAAIDKYLDKTLRFLCKKLSQNDQCLVQFDQECSSQGPKIHQNLKDEVRQMVLSQRDLKTGFYEFLAPLYQSGDDDDRDIRNLDLSQLPEEALKVIGNKEKDELVGLVEVLENFERWGYEIHETLLQLMMDFDVVPSFSEFTNIGPPSDQRLKGKEKMDDDQGRKGEEKMDDDQGLKGKEKIEDDQGLKLKGKEKIEDDQGLKGKEKISDQVLKRKEHGVSSVRDVAIKIYGFPGDIALQIEACLEHRKMIMYESAMNMDEAQDAASRMHETTLERSWMRVRKQQVMFKDLKEKIYEKPEVDLNGAPESLRVPFKRVIRNWIFHIESVFFNLIYEFYHSWKSHQKAETLFQKYRVKLENLKEISNGKVPITVYKTIDMLENPREFKAMGVAIRKPEVYRSWGENVYKNLGVVQVLDVVSNIITSLGSALSTAALSHAKLAITEDGSDSIEKMLEECEDRVRSIEGNVSCTKYEIKRKIDASAEEHRSHKREKISRE